MHTTSPTHRRVLVATLVALTVAAGLIAAACSGDDEAAPTSTTEGTETTVAENPGESIPEDTIPLSTVPDDEFADVVDGLNAQFDSAADSCGLLSVIFNAGSLPTPANPEQTKGATELLAGVLRRLAESPPPGQEASGPVLAAAADNLVAEGEASNWDPQTIVNSAAITDEVQTALGSYATACPELSAGGGAPATQPEG